MTETRLQFLDEAALDDLVARARASARRRQNLNLHPELSDPIQRLLNAGEPDTYVRPHRHRPGRWELVSVQRGQIDTLIFDDAGKVTARYTLTAGNCIEVPGGAWHGYVFVLPGTIALEIKPGPYDIALDKEFAAWAPPEGDPAAPACARWLAAATIGAAFLPR
jgi:cupin fold WbuC family metalloprotein